MYERKFTGRNCPTGYVTASELAKLMRADIKAAIAKGVLPGTTKNYTVRVHNYSGGRSINIRAVDLSGMWTPCKGVTHDGFVCRHYNCEHDTNEVDMVLTAEGRRIESVLKDIHSSYNYDASEVMVDHFNVNFYGSAGIETEWDARFRKSEKARKDAKKAKVAA